MRTHHAMAGKHVGRPDEGGVGEHAAQAHEPGEEGVVTRTINTHAN